MSHTSHLRSALLVGASALAVGAIAAPALADTADNQAVMMTETVVTAERREVNLQDVPVAISAFTGEQRDIQGINTIQDMTNFTPGLTYSTQLDRTNMRGLGRLTNILAADSAVAVYSDDFFTTSTTEAGRGTLFIDRVEVLRGPQGTLYGRNAIGGAINIISRRPTHDWYAEVRGTFGNYGYQLYEAAVSGPVTDFLRVRLAAYDTEQTGGYFHNIVPGMPDEGGVKHEWYVEGQLELDLGEHVQWWLKAFTQGWRNDAGGPGSLLGVPTLGHYDRALDSPALGLAFNPGFGFATGPSGPVPGSVQGLNGITDNPALTNIRNFAHNTRLDIDLVDTYSINSHITVHWPGVDLRIVSGYTSYDYNLNGEWDNTAVTRYLIPVNPVSTCVTVLAAACQPLEVFPSEIFNYEENNRWISHEILLSSTYEGPLQFIVGAFYFDEHYDQPTSISSDSRQLQVAAPLVFVGANIGNPNFHMYDAEYAMQTRSQAIYGQLDWQATEQFKFTAGLRYTEDHKVGDEFYRLILFNSLVGDPRDLGNLMPAADFTPFVIGGGPGSAPGVVSTPTQGPDGRWTRRLSADFSAVTGTAGAEWTPNEDTLVYFRYSRGYKAGGFNAGAISPFPQTQPEHVDAYEIGLKWSYRNILQLQSAIFYYDYQNAQIPIGVNITGTIQTQFFNIPRAVSDGFELGVVWSPIPHMQVTGTYSYNHTEIRSDCVITGGVVQPGSACLVDANDPTATGPNSHPVAGGGGAQSVRGSQLPQAPENKFAVNVNYTWDLGGGDLIGSVSYVWKDESFSSIFNTPSNNSPSWDQVDLRATWRDHNDRYEVILYVKNVFDTIGYEAAGGGIPLSTGPVPSYVLTAPRLFGIEIHYRWQ